MRHRRRALRAAGRHHQPERDVAGELDRDRDLGRGRRPRHADRARSSARSSSTARRAGSRGASRVLAVRPRRAVHRRHAVPAATAWSGLVDASARRRAHDARPDGGRRAPRPRPRASAPRATAPSRAAATPASAGASTPARSTSRTARSCTSTTSPSASTASRRSNELSLTIDAGRAALHHRPQRRRQDHDDGRHHRQDAARRGHGVLRPDDRPAAPDARPRSRTPASAASSRSRRCSSSYTVFENLELALKADKRRAAVAVLPARLGAARPHRRDAAT